MVNQNKIFSFKIKHQAKKKAFQEMSKVQWMVFMWVLFDKSVIRKTCWHNDKICRPDKLQGRIQDFWGGFDLIILPYLGLSKRRRPRSELIRIYTICHSQSNSSHIQVVKCCWKESFSKVSQILSNSHENFEKKQSGIQPPQTSKSARAALVWSILQYLISVLCFVQALRFKQ